MMIDCEKVIKGLNCCSGSDSCANSCPYYDNCGNNYSCTSNLAKDALALLKEQETKTGKWIEQTDYMGDTYYDCSVCNESWITIEGTPWVNGMNYCPHCGAKMEGR